MNLDRKFETLMSMLGDDLEIAKKNSIFETPDGYWVFDDYRVIKKSDGIEVHPGKRSTVLKFTSLRYAISWCVADKYRQFALADEILLYDTRRNGLQNDIAASTQMLSKIKNFVTKDVIEAKRSDKRAKLLAVNERLDKCANVAKYWQIRGFNNEIARTRRPASNRKNS